MKAQLGAYLAGSVPAALKEIKLALRQKRVVVGSGISSRVRFMLTPVYASVLLVIGIVLVVGGAYLVALRGSPYYLLSGLAVSSSAVLLWLRRGEGAVLYSLTLLGTLAWSVWEAGYDGWALMPRVAVLSILGLALFAPPIRRSLVWRYRVVPWRLVFSAFAVAIVAGVLLRAFVPPSVPADPIYQAGTTSAAGEPSLEPTADLASGDWRHYGNDLAGTRFSGLTQINPTNVRKLELAWSYRIGSNGAISGLQTTPLKIDRTLYLCTAQNDVIALDAETGEQVWRFDAASDSGGPCRGVAYYKSSNASGCRERIVTNTNDARLIAVDARDGKRCSDFGTNGEVSLLTGMGEVATGYYRVTSAPTIVRGLIVLGGAVVDSQYWGEPSGVIRAFDAITGKLAWAWDMGNPNRHGEPPPGERYTSSTPNGWAPMSADEELGLVYVPLGNASGADWFGGNRRSFDDQYSSSVVALDVATGTPRWSFQTLHHDVWDQDLPSQPTLVDLRTTNGLVHALLQPTKRGELFVIDRRTGAPIYGVEERPMSLAGKVPDDDLSASQPFSVGVPSFRGADLVELDMWGLTPLDQLWCRIQFRAARYVGPLTPPGLTPAILKPGLFGGMQWGGVAVDTDRRIAIVNSNDVPNYVRLLTRAEVDRLNFKRVSLDAGKRSGDGTGLEPDSVAVAFKNFFAAFRSPLDNRLGLAAPQEGTPYGVVWAPFLSPLQVPCSRPPYGRLSAVDLPTGKLIWTRAFGTAREVGPLGMTTKLPLPLGTPNVGGAVVTRSGLLFIGATQDRYFHAYETRTGRLLWRARLPAGGNATPMTYISQESNRQFVVIAAGGHARLGSKTGDSIMAYALPKPVL